MYKVKTAGSFYHQGVKIAKNFEWVFRLLTGIWQAPLNWDLKLAWECVFWKHVNNVEQWLLDDERFKWDDH